MSNKIAVGWASRDITPSRPVSIRGQFNLRIATKIQDPLTLTAFALESAGEQVIFVSLNSCSADQNIIDASREALNEKLPDFDPLKLVVNATHTHTAPFAGGNVGLQKDIDYFDALSARYPDYMGAAEYGEILTEALVSAACEAWQNRTEGSVGWGYSCAVIGQNRRVRYFDDHAAMYGKTSEPDFSHIEGHVDHGVNLLFTYAPDQQLTGIVVNVACPSQASEGGQDFVSADYWHDVREELRELYGDDLFVLPQCSAAGDQSPHRLIDTRAEARMLGLKHGEEAVGRPLNLALRQDIARRIAAAVADAEPAVRTDLHDTATLACEHHTFDVPHWNVTDEEYATLQEQMADFAQQLENLTDDDPLGFARTALHSRIAWCQRAVDRYENRPASIPVEMHVIRLGDIAFATAPVEYYLDFGDRIKGRSEALQTFVIQLAGSGTYLPTERAAQGLSYGAVPASCKISPEGGQVIVDEAVTTIAKMFATQ